MTIWKVVFSKNFSSERYKKFSFYFLSISQIGKAKLNSKFVFIAAGQIMSDF